MRSVRLAALAVVLALTACRQGEGERCQVDSDCEEGLVCTGRTRTCEHSAASPRDASPDAEPIDAMGPVDAAVDAAPDAMIDAGPV